MRQARMIAGFGLGLALTCAPAYARVLVELAALPPGPAGQNAGNIIGLRIRHTVENLEHSLALYRDALGLRGGPQVPPYVGDAGVLGLLGLPPDVQYRFTILTVPSSGLGIELIEFKDVRRPAAARIADPGVTRIQLRVADVDAAAEALVSAGGAFVSSAGQSVEVRAGDGTGTVKAVIVRDPDDLFVELIEAAPPTAP